MSDKSKDLKKDHKASNKEDSTKSLSPLTNIGYILRNVIYLLFLSLAAAKITSLNPTSVFLSTIVVNIVFGLRSNFNFLTVAPSLTLGLVSWGIINFFGMSIYITSLLICSIFLFLISRFRLSYIFSIISPSVLKGYYIAFGLQLFTGKILNILAEPIGPNTLINIKNLWMIDYSQGFDQTITKQVALLLFAIILVTISHFFMKRYKIERYALVIISTISLNYILGFHLDGVYASSLELSTLQFINLNTLNMFEPTVYIKGFLLAILNIVILFVTLMKFENKKSKDDFIDNEINNMGIAIFINALFFGAPVSTSLASSEANSKVEGILSKINIIHAFILFIAVYFMSTYARYIPAVTIDILLIFIAFRLFNLRNDLKFLRHSKSETIIYTFVILVSIVFDILTGLAVGLIASIIKVLFVIVHNFNINLKEHENTAELELSGVAFFFVIPKIRKEIRRLKDKHILIKAGDIFLIDFSFIAFLERIADSDNNVIVDIESFKRNQKNVKSVYEVS